MAENYSENLQKWPNLGSQTKIVERTVDFTEAPPSDSSVFNVRFFLPNKIVVSDLILAVSKLFDDFSNARERRFESSSSSSPVENEKKTQFANKIPTLPFFLGIGVNRKMVNFEEKQISKTSVNPPHFSIYFETV